MKYLLTILLTLFTLPAMAGDSGMYMDLARPGEGMLLQRNESNVVFFLFTFGAEGCYGYEFPSVGPFLDPEYDCYRQGGRWFYANDLHFRDDTQLSGFLYMAYGTNWPNGIQDLQNPFIDTVSESFAVAVYTMIRSDQGWRISIQPFGNLLAPDDPIFSRVWDYTTQLFDASD